MCEQHTRHVEGCCAFNNKVNSEFFKKGERNAILKQLQWIMAAVVMSNKCDVIHYKYSGSGQLERQPHQR